MHIHLPLSAALLYCAVFLFHPAQAKKNNGLDFITNGHQWPAQARYKANLQGGAVFLTNTGFTYNYYSLQDIERIHTLKHESGRSAADVANEPVHWHAYSVRFKDCNTAAQNMPQRKVRNYYNYFLGNDPAKWSGGMAAYEEIDYGGIYKDIDLHVYSKGASLKYDFVVKPGADASAIRMVFDGVTPSLTQHGDLRLRTSVNELLEKAPYAYQLIDGKERQVACRYVLKGSQVSFAFPQGYDRSRQLVIDPVLVFATYSGGTSTTYGWSATYDASGNLYAGGESFGTGWPVSTGAFQGTYGGSIDDGINKYSSNGTSLLYSTYYGGNSGDYPNTMVVNSAGELVVAGATASANLPTTSGCYDNTFNGGSADVYVAHFNAAGTALVGATYLGGSSSEGNISTAMGSSARGEVYTDASGNIYVAFGTNSGNFPTTSGAFQTSLSGSMDGFVSKLNSTCSGLLFSTYLGGSGDDACIALQVNSAGDVIVGGGTTSTNFPGTAAGWQSSLQGGTDGFIAVLNNTGASLLHATYVGTTGGDDVAKLQTDNSGNIYATGVNNGGAFPVSTGTYSVTNGKIYLCKLDASLGSRLLSTTISSSTVQLAPSAFLLDNCGNLYFVGYGASSGLVTTPTAYQTTAGGFWMCVLSVNMALLGYATYFGASGDHIDGGSSRLDPAGIVYHSICTPSTALPTTPSVWSPTKRTSSYDIASWKFDFQAVGMVAGFNVGPTDTFCTPAVVSFHNTSVNAISYLWDFGDGSPTSTLASPSHTYTAGGVYQIKLLTYNVTSCVPIDSAVDTVYVFETDTIKLVLPPLVLCSDDSLRMPVKPHWTVTVTPATNVSYQTTGGTEILFYPDSSTTYHVKASYTSLCGVTPDSVSFTIKRDYKIIGHIAPVTDTILCKGDTAVYELGRKPDRLSISPASYYQISKDSATIRFFPPVTTRYRITGMSANLCDTIRDMLDFSIHRSVIKAQFGLSPKITDQNSPVFHLTNTSKNATGSNWYLNGNYWTAATSPSLTVTDTGKYCFILVANDEYSCVDSATDCGRLIETRIYVPTAFTPNGDGKNDFFFPISRNVDVAEFSVYNRYGERVFVSYDAKHAWNGTYHGEPCDLGTYFYVIRYRILEYEPVMLKGDVTLIR